MQQNWRIFKKQICERLVFFMYDTEQKKEMGPENKIRKQDSDFITEKIKQRPVNKKKLLRRTLVTAAMAVLFSLVACLTFLILEPVISNWLYPEEEPAPIEFPAETEEILPKDMFADDTEMAEAEAEMEPPKEVKLDDEQIAQLLDSVELDMDDYSAMYSLMANVAENVEKSLVTVTGSVSGLDWFNDPYESKDQTSGVIVAKLEKEILILVKYEKVIAAESIMVTFYNGEQVKAGLRKKDINTGLAIISVPLEKLKKETAETLAPADFTASSGSRAIVGRPVIAVGSPVGSPNSVCYGIVTSSSLLGMTDSYYRVLGTDIYGSRYASGVLVNVKGQVLGIIDNTHNSDDMKNMISALGITELRKVIERMSNGKDQAYLGTHGMDVTLEANENLGVPFGAYITEIEMDSPAMLAGIQSGDVLTGMEGKEIYTYGDLVNMLKDKEPEEVVEVTLMRQGQDEYVQMDVSITLGILE